MNNNNFYQASKNQELEKNIFSTSIDGLYYIKYPKFIDDRGFFSQVLEPKLITQKINPDFQIKQVNLSVSKTKVIRGMHAEGWNKLITVASGHALCVLADIRQDSSTYKKIEYFDFQAKENSNWGEALYISAKIANSICAVEGPVYYLYGVDQLYEDRNPADDKAISVFDPDLNIQWPFPKEELIISQRDLDSITLKELNQKD
jgi:dTDP-4-dehydrorhamnose 3,5-epimerase